MDGERPDAEPAAGDGYGGAGVEFGGDGGEFATSRVACWSGVRWSADRSRTTEGSVALVTASSSPKLVSAEMITSPELAAWARMAWSAAASMPMSATCTASCPAAVATAHVPYSVERDEGGVWCAHAWLGSSGGANGHGSTPGESLRFSWRFCSQFGGRAGQAAAKLPVPLLC